MSTDRQELIKEVRGSAEEMGRQVAELLSAYGQTSEAAYIAAFANTFERAADALEQAETDLSRIRGWASRRTFCTCLSDFGSCPHAEVAALLAPSPADTTVATNAIRERELREPEDLILRPPPESNQP